MRPPGPPCALGVAQVRADPEPGAERQPPSPGEQPRHRAGRPGGGDHRVPKASRGAAPEAVRTTAGEQRETRGAARTLPRGSLGGNFGEPGWARGGSARVRACVPVRGAGAGARGPGGNPPKSPRLRSTAGRRALSAALWVAVGKRCVWGAGLARAAGEMRDSGREIPEKDHAVWGKFSWVKNHF